MKRVLVLLFMLVTTVTFAQEKQNKVAKTEEEVEKLFHYTNLQALWADDNWAKGSKIS